MNNPYSQQYTALSTEELLAIVQKPEEYQPLAVQAALAELAARGVNAEEQQHFATELQGEQQHPFQGSLLHQLSSLVRAAAPVYDSMRRRWRTHNRVTVLAAVATLYAALSLWSYQWLVTMWFTDDFTPTIDFSLLFSCIEALWMPIAALLLWRKNKAGWVMLVLKLPANIFSSVYQWIFWVKNPGMFTATMVESLLTHFQPSPASTIRNFILTIVVVLYACSGPLRERLGISTHIVWLCIAASLIFGGTLWFSLFLEVLS